MPASSLDQDIFKRHMVPMMGISVLAWLFFIVVFANLWPSQGALLERLDLFALWFALGTVGFFGAVFGTFKAFGTPARWHSSGIIALIAPALCLDMVATVLAPHWFGGSVGEARAYPALILGAVGVLFLFFLFMANPEAQARRA